MKRGEKAPLVKLLYVEDEPDVAESISEALVHAFLPVKVRIRHCMRADEALEAFRAFHPDVIVSDIGLPDSDGFSLIRKVRAEAPGTKPHTPAIALTAWDRSSDRELAALAGFDAHLPKPVQLDRLVGTLRRLLPELALPEPDPVP